MTRMIRGRRGRLRLFALLALILLFGTGGTDPLMQLAADFNCENCEEEGTIQVFPPIIRVLLGEKDRFVQASTISGESAKFFLSDSSLTSSGEGLPVIVDVKFESGGTSTGSLSSVPIKVTARLSVEGGGTFTDGSRSEPVSFTVSAVFDESGLGDSKVFQVVPVEPRIEWPILTRQFKVGPAEAKLRVSGVLNAEDCDWEGENRYDHFVFGGFEPDHGEEVTLKFTVTGGSPDPFSIFELTLTCGDTVSRHRLIAARIR